MRLTWRDAVTFGLLIIVGLVYYGYTVGVDLAVVSDTRGALVLIGASGLAMCIVGNGAGYVGKNLYSGLMSGLGIAALAIFLIGMVTALERTVMWLAIDVAVMWGAALAYRLFGTPAHRPLGA
jgi:hypothetical protein